MPVPYEHIPVLYREALEALAPCPGGRYLDATLGGGGHAAGILERCAPDGRLLGLDLDPQALEVARARLSSFSDRAVLVRGDYAAIAPLAAEHGFLPAHGVLFDLGFSSLQVEQSGRGFSFQQDAPLDMRFDPTAGPTAADLVNRLDEEELADLLWRYGEERACRRIAQRIVQARQRGAILRTGQLALLVQEAAGRARGRIHPATRTFQALRVAVNRELDRLPLGLAQAVEVLAPGGRLVVISYHSLEDRLVKDFFRREEGVCDYPPHLPIQACPHLEPGGPGRRPCRSLGGTACRLPVRLKALGKLRRPAAEEVGRNPRARSARMRVAERTGHGRPIPGAPARGG